MAHDVSSVDPWNWSVDDVVRAICQQGCELQTQNPELTSDLSALEDTIRKNQLLGRFLLLDVDNDALRHELNIKQFGVRRLLIEFIRHLREQSSRYKDRNGITTTSVENETTPLQQIEHNGHHGHANEATTFATVMTRRVPDINSIGAAVSIEIDESTRLPEDYQIPLETPSISDSASTNSDENAEAEDPEDPLQDAFAQDAEAEPAQVGIWDRLFEKYEHLAQDDDEEPLPTYGESGSENGYDTDTWEEMQAENEERQPSEGEKLEKHKELSKEEVAVVIETAKKVCRSEWEEKKRPQLQLRIYHFWMKAHSHGMQDLFIQDLELELDRLDERLKKYEESLKDITWATQHQLQVQCEVLYQTVISLCEYQHKLDVVKQETPPNRPDVLPRRDKRSKKRSEATAEEDLTDEELDDFIIDDSQSSMPLRPAPITHAPAAFIDLTGSDAEDKTPEPRLPQHTVAAVVTKQEDVLFIADGSEPMSLDTTSQERVNYLEMAINELRKVNEADISCANGASRVAWILAKHDSQMRTKFRRFLDKENMDESLCASFVQLALKGLRAMQYNKIRGLEECDPRIALEYAKCYFAWAHGFWQVGLDSKNEEETLSNEEFGLYMAQDQTMNNLLRSWPPLDFNEFYQFLLERIAWIAAEQQKRIQPVLIQEGKHALSDGEAREDAPKQKKSKTSAHELTRNADARQKLFHRMLQSYAEAVNKDVSYKLAYVNEPEEQDKLIAINSHISRLIQPHQLSGVKFLWDQIVNKKDGCLLAHSMGTGKTLQVVAFLNTLAETASNPKRSAIKLIPKRLRRISYLVIVPPSLVGNWHDEFLRWLPLDKGGIGNIRVIWPGLSITERLKELQTWKRKAGVVIISTNIFRDIVMSNYPSGKYQLSDEMKDILLNDPSLIVVDEAQELRNQNSKLYQAVRMINTRFRVALTGSPLSNHLTEYFNLIEWASPNYLEPILQNFSAAAISAGLYADATHESKRESLKRLSVLTQFLSPKVHRVDSSILDAQLRGKTEYLLRIRLTKAQETAYNQILQCVPKVSDDIKMEQPQLWAYLFLLRMICCHPKCLIEHLSAKANQPNNKKAPNGDNKTVKIQVNSALAGKLSAVNSIIEYTDTLERQAEEIAATPSAILDSETIAKQLEVLTQESTNGLNASNKMFMLSRILQFSKRCGERVLIFSHSLRTLNIVEQLVKTMKLQFIRIDGSTKTTTRHEDARIFNDEDCDVCIISTRAGGTGLNLFGASRVVIMDEWFNPMYEQQAIGRAYRIGQKRRVYVYRLVMAETYEEKMQNMSSFKSTLASRVLDRKQSIRAALQDAGQWLQPPTEPKSEPLVAVDDENVLDQIIATEQGNNRICSILVGNSSVKEEEELTEDEKREAEALLASKQRLIPPASDIVLDSSPVQPSNASESAARVEAVIKSKELSQTGDTQVGEERFDHSECKAQ